MRFPVVWSYEMEQEAGRGGADFKANASAFALDAASRAAAQVALMVAPPLGVGLMVFAIGNDVAYQSEHPTFPYAYRPVPEIVLVPATFDSGVACSTFFDEFKARLMAERNAERARIDTQCRPWPCAAAESACPNPLCERQRARAEANLAARLDEIPYLRAQTCALALPSGSGAQ